ncbi:hypothetical protein TWF281_000454 [Arthrobotrys megalospora]
MMPLHVSLSSFLFLLTLVTTVIASIVTRSLSDFPKESDTDFTNGPELQNFVDIWFTQISVTINSTRFCLADPHEAISNLAHLLECDQYYPPQFWNITGLFSTKKPAKPSPDARIPGYGFDFTHFDARYIRNAVSGRCIFPGPAWGYAGEGLNLSSLDNLGIADGRGLVLLSPCEDLGMDKDDPKYGVRSGFINTASGGSTPTYTESISFLSGDQYTCPGEDGTTDGTANQAKVAIIPHKIPTIVKNNFQFEFIPAIYGCADKMLYDNTTVLPAFSPYSPIELGLNIWVDAIRQCQEDNIRTATEWPNSKEFHEAKVTYSKWHFCTTFTGIGFAHIGEGIREECEEYYDMAVPPPMADPAKPLGLKDCDATYINRDIYN